MVSKEVCPVEFRGKSYGCHLEVTLDLIGGKWKSLLLWHLGQKGVMRFGALGRIHPKLTEKMLAQQLKELEADGLVSRKMYNQIPPKVEYSLTDRGRALGPVLDTMITWGKAYVGQESVPTN
jgi:DNA-binding HxlR family transcriptional regulator